MTLVNAEGNCTNVLMPCLLHTCSIDDSPLSKMVNASSACAAMVIRCLDHPHGLMERTFPVAWTREGFPVNDSSTQVIYKRLTQKVSSYMSD